MSPAQRIGFDLDGVLIRNPFGKGVMPHLAHMLAASPPLAGLPPEEARQRVAALVRREVWARMEAGRLRDAYDWDAIYRAVSRRLQGPRVPSIAGLVRHYCSVPGMIGPHPGAVEALDALQRRGLRLCAVTNGFAAYQWPVLEALGMAPYFEALFSPDRVGAAKPQPELFEAARPLDLFVGDTLLHDVYGARRSGIPTAWVAPDLPASLVPLEPWERVGHPTFDPFLAERLEASPYRRFHPEATLRECRPDAVLVDVGELAAAVDRWLPGRAPDASRLSRDA